MNDDLSFPYTRTGTTIKQTLQSVFWADANTIGFETVSWAGDVVGVLTYEAVAWLDSKKGRSRVSEEAYLLSSCSRVWYDLPHSLHFAAHRQKRAEWFRPRQLEHKLCLITKSPAFFYCLALERPTHPQIIISLITQHAVFSIWRFHCTSSWF